MENFVKYHMLSVVNETYLIMLMSLYNSWESLYLALSIVFTFFLMAVYNIVMKFDYRIKILSNVNSV